MMVSESDEEKRTTRSMIRTHSVVSERVAAVVESFDGVCVVVDTVVVRSCGVQGREEEDELEVKVESERAREGGLAVEEESSLCASSIESRSNLLLVDVWAVVEGYSRLSRFLTVLDDFDASLVDGDGGGRGEGEEG